MVNANKTSHVQDLPECVPTERRVNGIAAHVIPIDELRKRNDSLIENIGALRFSIDRIEHLEGHRRLLRDMLEDLRPMLKANGHSVWFDKAGLALKETVE